MPNFQMTRLAASLTFAAGLAAPLGAAAQAEPTPSESWQACAATTDAPARLACFDRWSQRQQVQPAVVATPGATASGQGLIAPAVPAVVAGAENGCHDGRYSRLSRFWELEKGTDCGTFELRGYHPISMAIVASDTVNEQPTSSAAGRSATTAEDYRTTETRLQLSARVKVMKDIFTKGDGQRSDGLWVGYTQQSYWQFFSGNISRPFRSTDYEPEAMYVYPTDVALPLGWRIRYTGAGISHQSNGRTLPLSRSWNRAYLMAGMELDNRFELEARVWKRLSESSSGGDDNPGITDYIGRGEFTGTWHMDQKNTVAATLRSPLRSDGHGSLRLDYFRALGKGNRIGNLNDLRLHVQYFTGYGDSLLDYNRSRNVLSVGLALVDW